MNGPFGFDVLELTDAPSTNALITSGTTTLDLLRPPYSLRADDVELGLSARRGGALGGSGPYEDVAISIPLTISHASPSLVYAALETLTALLEESQAWRAGQWVPGVRLRGKLAGSLTAQPSECVVFRPRDAEASMALPTIYQPAAGGPPGPYAMDVDLALVRRGQWLQAQESASAAFAAAGTLQTMTFTGARRILSPLRLVLVMNEGMNGGSGTDDNAAALIWAADSTLPNGTTVLSSANKIRVLEAEGFTAGGVFSSVADAAGQARGGNVLRYTPAVANTFSTTTYPTGTFGGQFSGRRILVYAVARKNTLTSVDYQVQLTGYSSAFPSASPVQPLTLPDLRPNAVFLGTILNENIVQIGIALSASATGGTLDIDYLVLVNVDDPTAGAIAYSLNDVSASVGQAIGVDPRPLTDPTGGIGIFPSGTGRILTPLQDVLGDPWLAAQGTTVSCVLMQPGGTRWRAYDVTSAALNLFGPTAIRWPAGLMLP